VRERRWLHDHITDLVTDVGPEGFADEAVLAGGTGALSILGFSTGSAPLNIGCTMIRENAARREG
jgi:hypothetical protein